MKRFWEVLALAFCLAPIALADEPIRLGLVVDERPIAPMRVEADLCAELAREYVAKRANEDQEALLEIVVPSESGFLRQRDAEPIDLAQFDRLWIFQGDEISQKTALFSPRCVDAINAFLRSDRARGALMTGGAVALLKPLGLAPELKCAPLTFGEDRNQTGFEPISSHSKLFDGLGENSVDRRIWLTNAAFPAFAGITACGERMRPLAMSADPSNPNPILVDANDKGIAKLFAHAVRISPLYDLAAPEFRNNYERLTFNLLDALGKAINAKDFEHDLYLPPDFAALERALNWFQENFDEEEYPNLGEYRRRLDELKRRSNELERAIEYAAREEIEKRAEDIGEDFARLQKEALLDNPEIDFDSFLYVRRNPAQMGLPENYNSNSVLPPLGYQDELRIYDFRTNQAKTLFKPENGEFVGDLELYYDASKVMFSSPDVNAENRWRLWELAIDEKGDPNGKPKILHTIDAPDVDNYDGCYLPDDRVVFCSTACMSGVPCINGSGHVCNLYRKELDGSVRQLTVEQDHDWNPVVMNNGRVMYLRWEYVDLPHAFSRIMFHMNPDGTNQSELYGSGSYWPNGIFGARPLPGDSSKFVGVVTGHHELHRQGELVIFDPAKGRKEASGAIQKLPGFGKDVSPIACDLPIAQSWPKFMHPYPISDALFLVSCKRSPDAAWDICLIDVFDNLVTLLPGDNFAVLEPTPLRSRERETVIPDRIDPESPTADVFIADVYEGEGLKGVPRGSIKALRIFSYEFAYQGMGAEPYSVGLDGPWDPRRILGTVPVLEDGSASFKIPAYLPISIQPLDENGAAVQIMRSWITAMPGEAVSCVGCHEPQNSTSPARPRTIAAKIKPMDIEPFYGETRGFSFEREIQPILDRFCVDCHAKSRESANFNQNDARIKKDFKRENETYPVEGCPDFARAKAMPLIEKGNYISEKSPLSNAYYQLRRFVRTPTKESQMPVHRPYEFHAATQPLVRLLKAGHYGVKLDKESWDKIIAWIDLNAPYYGNWGEILRADNPDLVASQHARREELRRLYAQNAIPQDDAPEQYDANVPEERAPQRDDSAQLIQFEYQETPDPTIENAPEETLKKSLVTLAPGIEIQLAAIPGTNLDVAICEITNEIYALFDPDHDSEIEFGDFIQFSPGERGFLLSRAQQPVARVSWYDAKRFCEWLSEKTGDRYRLPTASEWRKFALGNEDKFWFGDEDYSKYENLADSNYALISPFGWRGRVDTLPAWRPVDWNSDDGSRVAAPVGSYRPNPFGLFDVQGNVAEWTDSEVVEMRRATSTSDAGNHDVENGELQSTTLKRICGGSWRTRRQDASADVLRAIPPYFQAADVGFRVVREKHVENEAAR